jgi:hypothetical protein
LEPERSNPDFLGSSESASRESSLCHSGGLLVFACNASGTMGSDAKPKETAATPPSTVAPINLRFILAPMF